MFRRRAVLRLHILRDMLLGCVLAVAAMYGHAPSVTSLTFSIPT